MLEDVKTSLAKFEDGDELAMPFQAHYLTGYA
jgi:hypothetical protein